MAKGNTFITELLTLIFNNTNVANIGDATGLRGSTTAGSLYLALHTADPGAGGSQTTSEASYAGYARVAVARSGAGFTISSQSVTLAAQANFPQAPVGATDVLLFWSVGVASAGASKALYSGPIGSNLGVGTTGVGQLAADTITIPGLTGVAVNDRIAFLAPTGGTIPTGLTSGTVYYVVSVASDIITVSTTLGGSAVNITAAGQVLAYKVTPITTGGGVLVTPGLTTGTTITEF